MSAKQVRPRTFDPATTRIGWQQMLVLMRRLSAGMGTTKDLFMLTAHLVARVTESVPQDRQGEFYSLVFASGTLMAKELGLNSLPTEFGDYLVAQMGVENLKYLLIGTGYELYAPDQTPEAYMIRQIPKKTTTVVIMGRLRDLHPMFDFMPEMPQKHNPFGGLPDPDEVAMAMMFGGGGITPLEEFLGNLGRHGR